MLVTTDNRHYQDIAAAIREQNGGSDTYTSAEMAQAIRALPVAHVYGVTWDGGAGTQMTRTDRAKDFPDPSPAVANGSGSSPFDNLMPWAGMVRSERTGGTMVAIPKFWYRWTRNGDALSLQIADGPVNGFYVSPAHANRGDGSGERDVVYVGRYHCGRSTYKSETNKFPQASVKRAAARENIHSLGEDIWQLDFAMRVTIWMLYLVEFADWNSQGKIGCGCSSGASAAASGKTDAMLYHTGTSAANRTDYGFTQYRNIEGLWDNVYDWVDGCYYSESGMSVILKPSDFDDASGGTLIGKPAGGYPTVMEVSAERGMEWALFPAAAGGSNGTYVPDKWELYSSRSCFAAGGSFMKGKEFGLFYMTSLGETAAGASNGCRLMELPSA